MDLLTDVWDIDVRPGGWFRLRERAGGPLIYLHYAIAGPVGQERIDLRSVVMLARGDEALSGRIWRRLPLSNLETMLSLTLLADPVPTETGPRTQAQARDAFTAGVDAFETDAKAPTLDTLDQYFEATEDITTMYFNPMPSGMLVSDKGRIPQIKAPEGRLTDDFLKDVADVYRWATDSQQAPAPVISELADVPVRTVHRWVYEARKRGILPPARTGRAG
ncbi:hypothetical protein ABZ656_04410 [Streptomyces sp. NPDC007095]|uniref:hypothetical protein n=1 Tax=Streptomyces sp. NPDC007095 TaxID=3154482 RepID=UPI00340BEA72